MAIIHWILFLIHCVRMLIVCIYELNLLLNYGYGMSIGKFSHFPLCQCVTIDSQCTSFTCFLNDNFPSKQNAISLELHFKKRCFMKIFIEICSTTVVFVPFLKFHFCFFHKNTTMTTTTTKEEEFNQ